MGLPMRQAASGRLKKPKKGLFGLMSTSEVVDFWGKKFGVSNASSKIKAPIRGPGGLGSRATPRGRMLAQEEAQERNEFGVRPLAKPQTQWPTGKEPAKPKDIMDDIWAKHKARLNKG